jgi:signal transduction histidine kinase
MIGEAPVRGRIDGEGRLVSADPGLSELQAKAGGKEGGPLAVPGLAAVGRLALRLGIPISRQVIAADDEHDLDLWVDAEPKDGSVDFTITGWTPRSPMRPLGAYDTEKEADFLRAAADWMWETDSSLRFTALSALASQVVGGPANQLVGMRITELFRLEESEGGTMPLLSAIGEQRSFDGQYAQLRGENGGCYLLAGIPLLDGSGHFTGFLGSATRLNDAQGADSASGSNLVNLGGRIERALRDPLEGIITDAEAIATQVHGELSRSYAGYGLDIASAGRHMLGLVDDLVDLRAIERPDFAPLREEVDLVQLCRQVSALLAPRAAERGVDIDAPAFDTSILAIGERRRALQVVTNLLTNAIRYSPPGERVDMRCGREGDFVTITVTDKGKGIAPANQERIFKRFERVDPAETGGTGLGLYIARKLARAMDGDIRVESRPGEGARFIFTLPTNESR